MSQIWGRSRSLRAIRFTLVPLLFLAASGLAWALPPAANVPAIAEALVIFNDEINCQADPASPVAVDTLTIIGTGLAGPRDDDPVVTLGTIAGALPICERGADMIVTQLPDDLIHGNYLLSVAVNNVVDTLGSTIGAAGPSGPAGAGFSLQCEHNQVAKYNAFAEQWQCADLNGVVGDTEEFFADGTFVVPEGVTRILIEAWGPGGNGGALHEDGIGGCAGGGGGGGGYSQLALDVTPGQEFDITIGAESMVSSVEMPDLVSTSGQNGTDATTSCSFSESFAGGPGGIGQTANGNPGGAGKRWGNLGFIGRAWGDAVGIGGAPRTGAFGVLPPAGYGRGGNSGQNGGNGYVLIRW